MADTLIITLVSHQKFGFMLQPVFASFRPEIALYSITEIASDASSAFPFLNDEEQKIVMLADRYSDERLMKSYSREKNESDFMKNVDKKNIDNYIRPFIEKRHREIIGLVAKTKTPIFLREKTKIRDFRLNQALELMSVPSKMVFIFRNREIFTYTAKVQNGESGIELHGKFFATLASNPAVVIIGGQLHCFRDVDEKKLKPFLSKKQIEVPANHVPNYIRKFVLQCVKNYETIGEGLTIFEQKYKPKAILTLEMGISLQPVLNLMFQYGETLFAIDKPYKKEVELQEENGKFSIGWYYRDRKWEEEHIRMLTTGGLWRTPNNQFITKEDNNADTYGVVEWVNRNGSLLKNFELKQFFGKRLYYTGEIELQLDVRKVNDWFDINSVACFGMVKIPFIQFRSHILNDVHEYVLPDGKIAILPREWFTRFSEMFRYGKTAGNTIQLGHHHFRVKELAENGCFQEEEARENLGAIEIPPSLYATLRPYQKVGFYWLVYLQKNGFGGCLADDMGLGKTLQTITLLLHTYTEPSTMVPIPKGVPRQLSLFDESFSQASMLPPSLIVMPTSLIHNWLNELRKFAPMIKVYVHTGSSRSQDIDFEKTISGCQIVLTSYGIVRQDIHFMCNHSFHYLILDESQYIKNSSSQIFTSVKQLHATHKLALTGTPIENSLSDLWSQMDFLNEHILGKHEEFKARFRESNVVNDDAARQILLKIIEPFILRRTKEEVVPELPPLTDEIIYCEMDEEQAVIYNEEKNRVRNMLMEHNSEDAGRSFGAIALSSLTRLRLLANHPAISIPNYEGTAAKLTQIITQAEILFSENHKVLIFSSFVKHLQIIANQFDHRGWKYSLLTGSTVNREVVIDQFNSDVSIRAFLISLKAGGTGLNLTAADYVFIIDPWWNPASEMQAVSRAHRIGQDKKVTLYQFITKGTIEEKIRRLQQYKTKMTDMLIQSRPSLLEIKDLLEN